MSLGSFQDVGRTCPLKLHIRPYGDVFKTSAGDVFKAWYTILEDCFMLDSVWYHDNVIMILKSDWSN